MRKFILFYLGSHPDHRGRYLSEILEQDDTWLEVTHDYIQWLFPTKEFSRVTPNSPIITKEIEAAFLNDELLRDHLKASFIRLLSFNGLKYLNSQIIKSSNWNDRKENWFTQDTHNNLRITRILKSLICLGLETDAQLFYNFLKSLQQSEKDFGITSLTLKYWKEALG